MRTEKKWIKDQRRPYILITEDGDRIDLRKIGKDRGRSLEARSRSSSKYRNVLTEYNGNKYHSAAEAEYAGSLDQLIRAGEVKSWKRQVKFPLGTADVFVANYYADFVVTFADDHVEVHEVKGAWTSEARMKMKLFEIFYPETELKIIRV